MQFELIGPSLERVYKDPQYTLHPQDKNQAKKSKELSMDLCNQTVARRRS